MRDLLKVVGGAILCTVGFVVLLALAGLFGIHQLLKSTDQLSVEQSVPAPDARHVATAYLLVGGAGPGWCAYEVAINPIDEPFSAEQQLDSSHYRVYHGSCEVKPQLKWLSNAQIEITGASDSWAERLTPDATGQVSVSYRVAPNKSFKPTPLRGSA